MAILWARACIRRVERFLPQNGEKSEMILFNLDINNICASGGSACTSGADQGSHVIRAINNNPNQVTVRFSFSKYNTKEEVDFVVGKLKEMI
jgi:cysteine desulfurase